MSASLVLDGGAVAIWVGQSRDPEASVASETAAQAGAHSLGKARLMELENAERLQLLQLARQALSAAAAGNSPPELPVGFPEKFAAPRGCFVTLKKNHQLRGCIGHIFPNEALALAIIHNAANAALHDSRFSPVQEQELGEIEIEVSILTEPRPLQFDGPEALLATLRPKIDGVVLEMGSRRSTFLPQVWEQLPRPSLFLDHLAKKAGGSPSDWRHPSTSVLIYQVEAFSESEL